MKAAPSMGPLLEEISPLVIGGEYYKALQKMKPVLERERQLLELRQQGHQWPEIAALLGGSPAALRLKLTRAIDRVAQQLGLDEGPDE